MFRIRNFLLGLIVVPLTLFLVLLCIWVLFLVPVALGTFSITPADLNPLPSWTPEGEEPYGVWLVVAFLVVFALIATSLPSALRGLILRLLMDKKPGFCVGRAGLHAYCPDHYYQRSEYIASMILPYAILMAALLVLTSLWLEKNLVFVLAMALPFVWGPGVAFHLRISIQTLAYPRSAMYREDRCRALIVYNSKQEILT